MKITQRDIALAKGKPTTTKGPKPDERLVRLREQAAENGISYSTLKSRLYKYGYSDERAVTEPVGLRKGYRKGGRKS